MNSLADGTELCELGGVPIDRIAWRVIQPGEHYEPNKKITQLIFDSAPPVRGMVRGRGEKRPEDMKGRRIGRLTVYGYWGRMTKTKNKDAGAERQIWICRCDCGIFVTRKALTIKRARDPDDKCEYCRHLEYLKRQDFKNRTGKWPDQEAA